MGGGADIDIRIYCEHRLEPHFIFNEQPERLLGRKTRSNPGFESEQIPAAEASKGAAIRTEREQNRNRPTRERDRFM
jgi:hypothetical protein